MGFLSHIFRAVSYQPDSYFCSQIPDVNITSHAAKGIKALVPWLMSKQVTHNCYRDYCMGKGGDPGDCPGDGSWAGASIWAADIAIGVIVVGIIVGVGVGTFAIINTLRKRRGYAVLSDAPGSTIALQRLRTNNGTADEIFNK